MTKTLIAAAMLALSTLAAPAHAAASCEAQATERKLAGAARNSFIQKCERDSGGGSAQAACEKSADEKKLAGAARNSHIKKCVADKKPA